MMKPIVRSIEDELGGLNSDQRRDLRDCTSQLKKLMLSGADFSDLRRFLPPPGAPHLRLVLHELIKTELEARYARGQGRPLEEFIWLYPELGSPEDLPASLLYAEYRVRWEFGDHPAPEQYRARFPLQFEQFQRLVQQHAPPEPAPAPAPEPPAPSGFGLSKGPPSAEGYQLLERIGRGAYGDVYRALAPGGVQVAVKRIFRAIDDESSQRELKALERIRELRHPFLLQTHRFQAFEDRLQIVMELADGSLEDRLKQCRADGLPGIPVEELLRYFNEAAEALDYLHQQKLSHRNIKPQNLLHLNGHAKVADFGIARMQQNALDHTLNSAGTPSYMPPEMWRGNISVNSDQYSFALTWYEMRTGRRALPAANQVDLLQQHLTGKPDVSDVPQTEQKVLLRALAKEPDQRFPSCVAFVQALAQEGIARPQAAAPPARANFSIALVFSLVLLCFWLTMTLGPDGTSGGPMGLLLPVLLITAAGAAGLWVILRGLWSWSALRTGAAGSKSVERTVPHQRDSMASEPFNGDKPDLLITPAASPGPIRVLPRPESPFVEAEAPYVVGRPVRGELFVGRSDILKMIHDNLRSGAAMNVLVLRGQRRTGKSSVLLHLRETLARESDGFYLPVFVDVQGMTMVENEGQFFHLLSHQIWSGLETHGVKVPKPLAADFAQAPLITFELDFLQSVKAALGPRQILLMLDEFEMVKGLIDLGCVSARILDYFRHLMQHSPLLFLIAGTQKLRDLTGGYWSVFFNLAVLIDIGTLKEAEARWLITEPVQRWYAVEPPAIQEIVRVAGCHPYFTQLVCKQLLEVRNECRVNRVALSHVSEAIDRALQCGDEQIGYPWTEEDCSPPERLVLAALIQEGGNRTPVATGTVRSCLEDAGIAVAVGEAANRLRARGVLREDDKEGLTFIVPLFQSWLARKNYNSLDAALQYNEEQTAGGAHATAADV
jgi:hypothetical protein